MILPLQTFLSRVLLLRQQAFSSAWKSDPREANDNNYHDYNTSLHVSLRTRKFSKEIHHFCSFFVEEDIYIRDGPLRAVFKVNTLAVLFPPYPCEVKQIPRNLYLPPFWRLLVFMEMMQPISTRALSRARGDMRTHLTAVDDAVDLWPGPTPEVRDSLTSRHSVHAQSQV